MLNSISTVNLKGKIAFICDRENFKNAESFYKDEVNLDVYITSEIGTSLIENFAKNNINKKEVKECLDNLFSPLPYNAVVVDKEYENIIKKCKSLATPIFTI